MAASGIAARAGARAGGALREEVAPQLGGHAGRAHAGAAEGGDVTFAIDEHAEAFMERFLAERAPEVAFYSEDRGLVSPGGEAEWVLVVDPIDGTRPAMAGLRGGLRVGGRRAARLRSARSRRWGTSRSAAWSRSSAGSAFVAERGGGLEPAPTLSANTDLSRMFWAYGLRGRPMRAIAEVLGELIDASSVGGGTFDLGSATLRHDPDRHRPARRLRRAGPADRRRRPRDARGVRAGRRRRACSTTRPTTSPRRR